MKIRTRKTAYIAAVIILLSVYILGLWRADSKRENSIKRRGDGSYIVVVTGFISTIRFTADRRPDGAFTNFKLIESNETRNYASPQDISDYLSRLDGVQLDRISDVDGISSATVTTEVIRNILMEFERGGIEKIDTAARRRWLTMILFSALWGTVLFLRIRMKKKLLLVNEAVWFVIIGIIYNVPLSAYGFLRPMRFLPLLPAFAVASVLLYKNLYCSHICPFGFLQRLALFLPVKRRLAIPSAVRTGKWIILGLVLYTALFNRQLYVEPYMFLFSRTKLWWVYLLPGVMLTLSVFLPRLWCRAFCPVGALMHIGDEIRKKAYKLHVEKPHSPTDGAKRGIWISLLTYLLLLAGNLLLYLS